MNTRCLFLGERVVRPSERRLYSLPRGEVGTATSGRGYRSRLVAVLGSRFFLEVDLCWTTVTHPGRGIEQEPGCEWRLHRLLRSLRFGRYACLVGGCATPPWFALLV